MAGFLIIVLATLCVRGMLALDNSKIMRSTKRTEGLVTAEISGDSHVEVTPEASGDVAQTEEHVNLMLPPTREDKQEDKEEPLLTVEINSDSDFEPMPEGSAALVQAEGNDPCSNLGCNSMQCAWASGGVIRRMETKKACSNALSLGSSAGGVIPGTVSALESTPAAIGTSTSGFKISSLKDCMNAVRGKTGACSGHFQVHKDTLECSCVPVGADCNEIENDNICTYKVMEQE